MDELQVIFFATITISIVVIITTKSSLKVPHNQVHNHKPLFIFIERKHKQIKIPCKKIKVNVEKGLSFTCV